MIGKTAKVFSFKPTRIIIWSIPHRRRWSRVRQKLPRKEFLLETYLLRIVRWEPTRETRLVKLASVYFTLRYLFSFLTEGQWSCFRLYFIVSLDWISGAFVDAASPRLFFVRSHLARLINTNVTLQSKTSAEERTTAKQKSKDTSTKYRPSAICTGKDEETYVPVGVTGGSYSPSKIGRRTNGAEHPVEYVPTIKEKRSVSVLIRESSFWAVPVI